ncbi:DUF5698 domain-containing protein [Salsipaludibacter albus]|uniref:DUF5698 domain-containing protein n=1 Tax=Salsipaludibacter albus TaxID=2849650 RepID=UPI001EE3A38E|nr:hypothetical protein [Salsipaludibacter albus]MBY5162235.1 hypothetical protein [Salsipaludibacter albus]
MTDLLSPDLADAVASAWTIVLPALLVASLRVVDVTLNVFRTVFTVNGRKWLAAVFHALEGGTWLAAAGIVLADVTVAKAIGYVAGIMLGTLLGTTIVERLRLGMVTVRIYADARHDGATGAAIATAIREAGYGATVFTGAGMRGPVEMILSTVPRRRASAVIAAAGAVSDDTIVAVDNDLQPLATAARA